jgi:hypothetical protein
MRNILTSVFLIITFSSILSVPGVWSEKEAFFDGISYLDHSVKISALEANTTEVDEFSQESAKANTTEVDEFSQESAK